MVNMLMCLYLYSHSGVDDGQHVDFLYLYVLYWVREWSKCRCSCICGILLDSKVANMLNSFNFMYMFEFENCQHVGVLVFVIV